MQNYAYAEVEASLGTVFGFDAAGQKGSLRGRLIHLKRLGLAQETPGRGKRVDYALETVQKWTIALELEQFGLDPVIVAKILNTHWDKIRSFCRMAVKADPRGDVFFYIKTAFLAADSHDPVPGVTKLGVFRQKDVALFLDWLGNERAMVINLSSRIKAIGKALETKE